LRGFEVVLSFSEILSCFEELVYPDRVWFNKVACFVEFSCAAGALDAEESTVFVAFRYFPKLILFEVFACIHGGQAVCGCAWFLIVTSWERAL